MDGSDNTGAVAGTFGKLTVASGLGGPAFVGSFFFGTGSFVPKRSPPCRSTFTAALDFGGSLDDMVTTR
jgi:hypothetical protein